MKEIVNYANKRLIIKYDNYYIRFIGGQYAELPCDIKITKQEAESIIDNHSLIDDVINDYRKKMIWSVSTFIQMGLEDFLERENHSKNDIEQIISSLNEFEEIKYEMYESIMNEEFPKCSLVQVNGKTAKDLSEENSVSIGESYLLLLELAKM